jgi:hypothetical protein
MAIAFNFRLTATQSKEGRFPAVPKQLTESPIFAPQSAWAATSALSNLRIGVLGKGWHTQSLRWVWFSQRIPHALRKASERATPKI